MIGSLTLLLACSSKPVTLPAGDPDRPDVIVVSVDTLRADHLSSYGNPRATSPFIDELAAGGVRFAHARSSSPWTLTAHTTLMTGQLPMTHRVVEDDFSVDLDTPVLAQSLAAGGYTTAGFVSTLYVSSLFGFQRGFDHFEDFGIHTEKANLSGDLTFDRVVDQALDWWAEQPAGQPVFLFLHTYDVHYEYDPPEPYASMFDRPPRDSDARYKNYFHFKKKPPSAEQLDHQRAQYDEAIRWVDDHLRQLDERLRASGRTVRWVVTSDHGEEFGERGSWGHAHTLYAEQLHIPLVIAERRPDGGVPSLPAGRVIQTAVGLHDVAPTVAAWVAGSAPLLADGIDLNPYMASGEPPERPFPAETTRFKTNRLGLYEHGLRLEWDLKSGRTELFEPATDPLETTDLSPLRRDQVALLQARLLELVGTPWTATRGGQVRSRGSGRVLVPGGGPGGGVGSGVRARVAQGQRFQVLPYDAEVSFQLGRGDTVGPWQATGRLPVEGEALSYTPGVGGPAEVELDEATRKALEALGYIQGAPDLDERGSEDRGSKEQAGAGEGP